jgi:hypothetical protein
VHYWLDPVAPDLGSRLVSNCRACSALGLFKKTVSGSAIPYIHEEAFLHSRSLEPALSAITLLSWHYVLLVSTFISQKVA